MSLASLSTEFSIELSRFLESAIESEVGNESIESCSTIMPNARHTNQISMKMDQINKELEDIKNSFNASTEILDPRKPQKNHLDRFDSIPANIKAYIRQEIQTVRDKLPEMISQAVKKEFDNMIKLSNDHSVQIKDSRPPWDNEFTQKIPNSETIASRLKKNIKKL